MTITRTPSLAEERIRYAPIAAPAGRRISGYAARFNVKSKPGAVAGDGREVLEPGCFAAALAAPDADLRLYWSHDRTRPLARQSAGNLKVWEDREGLRFEATLPDTPLGDEALELVRTGIVREMSFGFSMKNGRERKSMEGGETVYRIYRVGSIREISLVAEPAYPETSAEARQRRPSPIETFRAARAEQLRINQRAVYGEDSEHSFFVDKLVDDTIRANQAASFGVRQPLPHETLGPTWRTDMGFPPARPNFDHLGGGPSELAATRDRLRQARDEAEQRAASDTSNFAGLVAPAFIVDQFATAARAKGVLPATLLVEPFPENGIIASTARFTTGVSVDAQGSEGTAFSSTQAVSAKNDEQMATIGGFLDVSVQLLLRGGGGGKLDVQLAKEFGSAMGEKVDQQIVSGSGSGQQLRGLRNVSGVGTSPYTDATPTAAEFLVAVGKAYQDQTAAIGQPPDLLLLTPRRNMWLHTSVDTAGQPVQVKLPLTIVEVPAIPTNLGAGTNEDVAILVTRSEVPYLPAPFQFSAFDQPVAHQGQARINCYQFAYLLGGRRPRAITIISGTGLITPF
jgi:HK97 family phage prohead protease